MNKTIAIILGLLLLGGIGFAVLKKSNSSPASEPIKTEVTPNTVTIDNYVYSPKTLMVKKGTTVTWKNNDIAKHTITADSPSENAPSSKFFGKNESYSFTFNQVGEYAYHCEPHPYMKGSVTVTE